LGPTRRKPINPARVGRQQRYVVTCGRRRGTWLELAKAFKPGRPFRQKVHDHSQNEPSGVTTDPSSYFDYRYDESVARQNLRRAVFNAHSALLLFTLIALVAMGVGVASTLRPVTLQIDRETRVVLSNQRTVPGILHDAAITLSPRDTLFPDSSAIAAHIPLITIRRARTLEIDADGALLTHRTQAATLADALREANLILKLHDRLTLDGVEVPASFALARIENDHVLQVHVQRAVPLVIDDNGAATTLYTTAPTIGEALRQAGLTLYLGDSIMPDLGTPVAPGWQVYIRRSRAATINVDGKTIRTRTRSETIAGLLAQEGIELQDKDYTIPPATDIVRDDATIQVMRVREEFFTDSEYINYETVWQADPTLEIDQRRIAQVGAEGVKKRTTRVVYENGRETKRTVEREWIETPPTTQIINYGTKIVKRELTLSDGSSISYWRKIRMLATSYTAATSGKARTHPEFGVTATGMRAGVGIVAVDPRVINLRSRLYIPGYGLAIAGDTGGRIKGKRIDLGYDESNLVLWYKWVDVYILDPIPPYDQIHWVIPDTPKERTTPH
jgi:uncharacterized protein YabE (DUF348 family)